MQSISSLTSGLVLAYLYFSLLLIPTAEATMTIRQAPSPTAVSVPGPSNVVQQVIIPALRTLIAAPLRILHQLYLELRAFLATHNLRQMFDVSMVNQLLTVVPKRISEYWTTFREVETACVRRTLCDLADHTSGRVPHWFNQILTIYFTTFSQNSQYYQAVLNGLVSHNCPAVYPDCDPSAFMNRLTGNVGQSLNATVGPVRDAFNNLMAVTVSTIDSVASAGVAGLVNPLSPPRGPLVAESDVNGDRRLQAEDNDPDQVRPQARPDRVPPMAALRSRF